MVTFKIIRAIIKFFMFFVFRIKVIGKENMPKEGGAVVAINHRSNWDVIVAGISSPRQLGYMAKAELFENKLFGRLITALGAFPLHRGKGDISAIKAALARLRDGEIVAMFPEGRRVKHGETSSVKPGAVMLAQRAQVMIVPIKISGNYKWLSKITLTIGQPISYEDYYCEKMTVEALQQLSDDMMKTINSLSE